jgi:hypothetical protein
VPFTGDGGAEINPGFDDAGNASRTTCNPLTNSGCTGTDICIPDNSGNYWVCIPITGATIVQTCNDCSGNTALCAKDNICIQYQNDAGVIDLTECVKYCCTDADCGGTSGSCNKQALSPPLANGVGICSL